MLLNLSLRKQRHKHVKSTPGRFKISETLIPGIIRTIFR